MATTFPPGEAYDATTMTVNFPADNNGQRIACRISEEALQDHFGANGTPPLGAFRGNRPTIEAKAEALIRNARFENDGGILIRTADF